MARMVQSHGSFGQTLLWIIGGLIVGGWAFATFVIPVLPAVLLVLGLIVGLAILGIVLVLVVGRVLGRMNGPHHHN